MAWLREEASQVRHSLADTIEVLQRTALGYDRRELASMDIASIGLHHNEAMDSAQLIPQIFAGNAFFRASLPDPARLLQVTGNLCGT
jgi:hypothetical protein